MSSNEEQEMVEKKTEDQHQETVLKAQATENEGKEQNEPEEEFQPQLNADQLEELRAQQQSRERAVPTDLTAGGLLNEEGEDVRRAHADEDERRKGTWRGMALAQKAEIQWDFAIETLDYKIQAMILGSDLRIFIVFIVMFCFFFLVGRDINANYYFSKAAKDPLVGSQIAQLKVGKTFDEISEAREFNLWAMGVVLYQTIDLDYPTGGNYFVGAMRFRTQRVRKDTCTINTAIIPTSMPALAQECYGEWSDKNAETGTTETDRYNQVHRWEYKSCEDMGGGSDTSGIIATYNCGGYYFEVPWWRNATSNDSLAMPFPSKDYERLPQDVAMNYYVKPALMNDPPFVDNLATRFVIVETFMYNPTLKTFLSVKLYVEQAAGGLWIPDFQFRVFDVWTSSSFWKTMYDGVFYLFVFYYWYHFFGELFTFYRRENKILAFFFNTWNLMEFLNLIIFVIVLIYRIMWIVRCASTDLDIEELTYHQWYPVALDDILLYYMMQVYLNSVNTVLTFIKFLKFFRLNDRLNILTRTLSESQDSIIGVLFIFLLVVTAFAMTGHGLFGLGVWRFRSIDSSFSTLLLMLLGQFNYEEMKNENRVQAGFFFWAYIILGLFCLLNFLIGVLMEAFAEVSSTKPILPLETVLVKTWEDFKRVFHPGVLWHSFKQSCKGNSKEAVLSEAVEMLKAHRFVRYPENCEIPEERQQMSLEDFESALDEEIGERIGKEYLAYVWDDLVYEWDMSKNAQEAIESRRNLEMTTRGVRSAIGEHLDKIEGFSARMTKLEENLTDLVEMLERK